MRKSKCRGIPSKPALLTEHETLPAQKSDRRESTSGDSADKMTQETCPGKNSNGKEKRPRSRRENVSVPGFFRPSPEKKIPSPGILFSGLGISRSGSEISRRTAQKVKDADKILHKSPVLCKKIARKSSIWVELRKSRVTEISQNGTICLFLQAFYDILIMSPPQLIGSGCIKTCEKELLRLVGELAQRPEGFHPHGHTHKVCLCGRETPPSLRATSPTRRRSLFCYALGRLSMIYVYPR